MTFRHLEAFVQVALQGGFTRAAEKLCLTQPTVSGQIKELEQELEVVLFHRLPRSVQLTEVGQLFLPKARELLRQREAVREWVASYRGLLWGELVVHASTIPGECLLPPVLAEFKRNHPEILIRLQVGDSEQVLQSVRQGDAAVGVAGKQVDDDALCFEPLWRDRIRLYCGQGQAGARQLDVGHLAQLPVVIREQGSGTLQAVNAALTAHGLTAAQLQVVAEFGSNAALKQAVVAGVGVGFLSEESVRCEVERQHLIPVELAGLEPIERHFYAVWGRGRSLSPASEAFLAQLRTAAATG